MSVTTESQIRYLLVALAEAQSRRGFCAPNPAVGAVIVKDDQVIATGRHWACGHPHAEVDALHKAGSDAADATLLVTLEPCCYQGKTPPCTELIIQRGLKRVIFAVMDANPMVAGKGIQALREAGVDCQQVEVPEISAFYCSYAYWTQKRRPWVTMKLALSADDKVAGANGAPLEMTGEACRDFTHRWRGCSDALLTTVQTIINDDPQMNVRSSEDNLSKPIYLLDSQLRLPLHARIFKTAKNITVYHRENCGSEKINNFQQRGLRCVAVDADASGLNLEEVLDDIGQQGIHDLWVEVGARCFQSFYQAKLAQRIFIYRSKKIAGEHALSAFSENFDPFFGKAIEWKVLGDDKICELRC